MWFGGFCQALFRLNEQAGTSVNPVRCFILFFVFFSFSLFCCAFTQDVNLEFSSVFFPYILVFLLANTLTDPDFPHSDCTTESVAAPWRNMFYPASYLFFTVIFMMLMIIMITSFGILIFLRAVEPMASCKWIVYLSSYFWAGLLLGV